MDVRAYVASVARRLPLYPGVARLTQERRPRILDLSAVYAVRVWFFDGSYLDIRERIEQVGRFPTIVTYSYQYIINRNRIFRYDNAPDHRQLPTFPHHKHIPGGIIACWRPSHKRIFKEIEDYIDWS